MSYNETTLDLLNGRLLPGNASIANGHGPSTPAVYDPATGRYYIFTIYSTSLAVVDAARGVDIGNIPLNLYPNALAIDPLDHSIFLTNTSGSTVVVVNATTLSVSAQIAVGSTPEDITWDAAAQAMVVANSLSNNTSWIDGVTHRVIATVPVGGHPQSVLYDPLTKDLLVANSGTANVSVINSSSLSVTSTVGVWTRPQVVFQNPESGAIYVANGGSGNTTPLNGSTYAYMGSIAATPGPNQVAYDPGTHRVFLIGGTPSGGAVGLYASNDSVATSTAVTFWSRGLTVDPATSEVYVSGGVNNSVTVLNGSSGSPIVTVPSAYTPTALQYDPLAGEVYVSEEGGANISAINETTHRTETDILTGTVSFWNAANPADPTVYVGGGCAGNNLATVNGSTGAVTGCASPSINGYASTIDPVDHRLFIVDGSTHVYVLNLSTGVFSLFVNLSTSPYSPSSMGIAWSPIGDSVYVTNWNWNNVSVFNASNGRFITAVGVGSLPLGAIYDPYDGSVWIADSGGSYISRIDARTNLVNTSVFVGQYPQDLALDPITQGIYVTLNGPGELAVLNASTETVEVRLAVGTWPIGVALDPVDQLVFVGNSGSSNVTAIDPFGLVVVASIPTVASPQAVSYDAAGRVLVVSGSAEPAVDLVRPTLNAGPEVTSFQAIPASIPIGQATRITATVVRGNGTLTFSYSGIPPGCASANSSSLNCTPSRLGTYTVRLTVTDQAGNTASATTSFSVTDQLSISSLTALPQTIDLGMATTLTAVVAGPVGPFSFTWVNLPPGCTPVNASSLSCHPTQAGNYGVSLTVRDPLGVSQVSVVTVVVNPIPVVSSLTASPTTLDLGDIVRVTAAASLGTPPLKIVFSDLPSGCLAPPPSNVSFSCRPNATGSYLVNASVIDSLGSTNSASVAIVVNADPSILSVTVSPNPSYVGERSVITVVVSGGTAPFAVTYTNLPSGCATASTLALLCIPSAAGSFSVAVAVTDSQGHVASSRGLDRVADPGPAPQVTRFAASPSNVTIGNATTLTAVAVGGLAPLNYSFSGLPNGCTTVDALSLRCIPTELGTFSIVFHATDATGRLASLSTSLTVSSPESRSPTPTSGSGNSPASTLWIEVGIGVAVAAAAVTGLLLLRRRRRGGSPPA